MPQTTPTQQHSPKLLHIFKPGRWTTMAGESIAFSQADLQASAAAYDPRISKAPIVVGHPTTDAPAKGWAMAAVATERGLFVAPEKVDAAFAEEVKAGRWGAVSVKFYRPTEPTNPVPGSWYIRHVGFLGAANPAVKGLDAPEFADPQDAGCVCFMQAVALSEYDDVTNAALWRNLREHLIGTVGQDKADAVIPGYMVASLEQAAQDEVREAAAEGDTSTPATPQFNESTVKENLVTPEEKAALEAENTRLKAELAANKAAQIHAAHVAFCEGTAGVLPAWRAVAVATLDHLAAQPEVVQFGEGDAVTPLAEQLKAMLAALPAAVQFGEAATKARAAGAEDTSASFSAPQGFTANKAALSQHALALAYQKAHGGSFKDAALAVSERN